MGNFHPYQFQSPPAALAKRIPGGAYFRRHYPVYPLSTAHTMDKAEVTEKLSKTNALSIRILSLNALNVAGPC